MVFSIAATSRPLTQRPIAPDAEPAQQPAAPVSRAV
jgi:hypothetical protein